MREIRRRSFGLPRLLLGAAAMMTLVGAAWILGHLLFPPQVVLPAECPDPALLAHRSNSVALAEAAAFKGFCGLEVDIQWRDGSGLVVSHDELPPTWSPAGSITLAGLLDSISQQPFLLWLDFKNLSRENATAAARYLHTLMQRRRLEGRLIVESRNPGALWVFHRQVGGIVPAYWIPNRPAGRRGLVYDAKLALVLGSLALPALSIPQKQLTAEFAKRFRRFALLTWTCNTPEEMRTATELGARVILTDKAPEPANPTTDVR